MSAVADLRPFAALRPLPSLAPRVAAPPYDVVDADEAAAIMRAAPDSFLRVTRPDADPWLTTGSTQEQDRDEQHEHGLQALRELVRRGVLVHEHEPAFWVYRQQVARGPRTGHVQTGVVGLASVADYTSGAIRVHEHTRPDKEEERAQHVDALDAHDEPVLLFHRGSAELAAVTAAVAQRPHDLAVTTPDGVWHTLWRVADGDERARVTAAFAALDALYVADGHHRSAAAARLHASRAALPGDEAGETGGFLAMVLPEPELTVLPYHRVVTDLGGLAPADLLDRLAELFDVAPADGPVQPGDRTEVGLRTSLGWHRVRLHDVGPAAGGVRALAVSLLQDQVLGPVLGIADPRRDQRLGFVGGPDGLAELEARVGDGRAAAAFALAATSVADLVAVSDAREVLPPKSTWFWPKPLSGLLVHPLH